MDENKLTNTLNSNLAGVEQVFAFISTNTTGGYFNVISHPKQLSPEVLGKEIMVNVTKDATNNYSARLYLNNGGVITQDTSIAIGSSDIKVNSTGFVYVFGPKNSVYEGLSFFYSGPEISTPIAPATNTETQGFKVSQGLGDLLSEKLNNIVLLQVNSNEPIDQKNELNKIVNNVRRVKLTQQKKLEELKEKNARTLKDEERKAEKFQREMEKVQSLVSTLTPLLESMVGK